MHRMLPPASTRLVVLIVAICCSVGLVASGAVAQDQGERICDEFVLEMSDGVRLHGRGSRVAPDGPRPVLLSLTHYGPYTFGDCPAVGDASTMADPEIVERFAIAHVSMRGTGASEGVFDHLGSRTQEDIRAVVAWAAEQPWSNGTVIIEGASGAGFAEAFTVTDPHVAAIIPITTCFDTYRGCFRPGGVYNGIAEFYQELILDNYQKDLDDRQRLGLDSNPPPAVQLAAIEDVMTQMRTRDRYDEWWQERSGLDLFRESDVPTYFTTDVFDFLPSANYDGYRARADEKLNLGWGHAVYVGPSSVGRYDELVRGSLDAFLLRYGFGETTEAAAATDIAELSQPTGNVTVMSTLGSVESFMEGDLLVRAEERWPLPSTRWTRMHLAAGPSGSADSLNDGALSLEPAADAGSHVMPLSSAPSTAGNQRLAFFGAADESGAISDMRSLEASSLTYTTPPLHQDVEVTGPIVLRLFASATTADFDWSVILTDVAPDGRSEWISDGLLRASLRRVDPERSQRNASGDIVRPWHPFDQREPVPTGEIVEYLIEITPISNVFQQGHRIRLDLLPNAGGNDSPTTGGTGSVTIHHGSDHPSSLLLPVIPSRCHAGTPLKQDVVAPAGCALDLATALAETVPPAVIERYGGPAREDTAVAVSGASRASADTVVIARADAYPDALTGGPLAVHLDAPLLLSAPGSLSPTTAEEIRRLGASRAVLLGGEAALSPQIRRDLEALNVDVDRIAGTNRFATAAAIAAELPPTTEVFVARGERSRGRDGFPDAASASGIASGGSQPVLLSADDRLPAETAAALSPDIDATIVGGPAAVSRAVAAEVDRRTDEVTRLAGDTRYGTSRAVAEEALARGTSPAVTWVATGARFPDALVAGSAVGHDGGVLLLIDSTELDDAPAPRDFLAAHARDITTLRIAGGTAAISSDVEEQLQTTLNGTSR